MKTPPAQELSPFHCAHQANAFAERPSASAARTSKNVCYGRTVCQWHPMRRPVVPGHLCALHWHLCISHQTWLDGIQFQLSTCIQMCFSCCSWPHVRSTHINSIAASIKSNVNMSGKCRQQRGNGQRQNCNSNYAPPAPRISCGAFDVEVVHNSK